MKDISMAVICSKQNELIEMLDQQMEDLKNLKYTDPEQYKIIKDSGALLVMKNMNSEMRKFVSKPIGQVKASDTEKMRSIYEANMDKFAAVAEKLMHIEATRIANEKIAQNTLKK